MAIVAYLVVSIWRGFLRGLVTVWEYLLDDRGRIAIGLVLMSISAFVYFVVERNQYEIELLARGTCVPVTEQLYTPPPIQVCTVQNDKGNCLAWRADYNPPYMRTLVRCEGEPDFWRRTQSIPPGSFK